MAAPAALRTALTDLINTTWDENEAGREATLSQRVTALGRFFKVSAWRVWPPGAKRPYIVVTIKERDAG